MNIHWGRFAGVVGGAFVGAFFLGFGSAMNGAQAQLGATATAQDLLRAISAATVSGALLGIGAGATAAGAFFVPPRKEEGQS